MRYVGTRISGRYKPHILNGDFALSETINIGVAKNGETDLGRVSRTDFRMGGGTDGVGQRSDGGGLARDSRQIREVTKLSFNMLKKRLFVKQNH